MAHSVSGLKGSGGPTTGAWRGGTEMVEAARAALVNGQTYEA